MGYIEGFVVAVPAANEAAYRRHSETVLPLFKELGVTRMVQTWGDEVPDGKVTDFKRAVQAKSDEVVVFTWLEYPSKAVRDAANQKMMNDPAAEAIAQNLPFDGQRVIFAGFETLLDLGQGAGKGGKPGYVDATLLPVPVANKAAFRDWAARMGELFREHGATRVLDGWGDDVPDGKVTDFRRAVKAGDGETVVYGWIEWPAKGVRDAAWGKLMADPRMQPDKSKPPLFDGQRMVYGGFTPILDA